MGTNYYFGEPPCAHCGAVPERLHVGKASAGWVFALHVIPDLGLTSLDAWVLFMRERPAWAIENDNGVEDVRTIDDLLRVITQRSWSRKTVPDAETLARNHAVLGPNGLLRSRVDGIHCVGNGEGTWDLITGEFS